MQEHVGIQTCFGVTCAAVTVHFYHKRRKQKEGILVQCFSPKAYQLNHRKV